MPKDWKYHKQKLNAPKRHNGGENFLCMGDRFYGTLSIIIWKPVYTASSGLCFQMGGSSGLSKE